ncbi:MAG: efflux RND transporter periplasmic adaptor subunit [Pseudomonadota bacterium]
MKDKRLLYGPGWIWMVPALLFLCVACQDKIDPETSVAFPADNTGPGKTAAAAVRTVTDWYGAVGTIRPRTEAGIQAQITAQVTEVKVRSGDNVQKGQVLASLDNRQFLSRLDQARESLKSSEAGERQARQAVVGAEAAHAEARSAFQRTKKYYESQAATSQDLEQAESAYLQAEAGLQQARQALSGAEAMIRQARQVVNEAEIALGYTVIKAPEDGEILQRMIDPGDLALPGKPLIVMRTSGLLRLEAYVREGLIDKVKPGVELDVDITTLQHRVRAVVEEIVPYADPQTRTFLVKASLPHADGLYPGMFGKLLIPVKEHPAVIIPREAVRQVGQLELVWVQDKKSWKNRYVKTGQWINNDVEILSGLSGNEIIGWGGTAK